MVYSTAVNPAVISAVAALAGVLLGQALARSGEYRKWLRTERHRACAEMLAAGEALRRHSAGRVLAAYRGDPLPDDASEVHLTDLERLGLALEAFRTVFPGRVAVRAELLSDAARTLARLDLHEPSTERQTGNRYLMARDEVTQMARLMIAPTWGERLRSPFSRRRPGSRLHNRRASGTGEIN